MIATHDPDRIRERLRPAQFGRVYRLIHRNHSSRPLDAVPTPSRFSDPAGHYSVLYVTVAVRCGFWEALARNRFTPRRRREIPRSDVESRVVVTIASTECVQLVDLRGDGPIRIGAPTAVAHDANHAAARSLSTATYVKVPEADGFLFQSRFTGHVCAAVFDRAFGKLAVVDIAPLVDHVDFLQALIDYDITLTTPGQRLRRY